LPTAAIEDAARQVYEVMLATAQYAWPLLAERLGCKVWVKHENHTPTGAFKVRGGITFMHWLKQTHPQVRGVVSATRGNHGQSPALAAKALGLQALIVVPRGNSVEKNNAMRGFGAELVAALAALMQERDRQAGKTAGVILSGGNIDRSVYAHIIA
jgi:threonine dehydratase